MGIEKTHGRNYDLVRLLSGIDAGEIVLPEFQRDFVWETTAVKQLVATCLAGWPIGSLLLLPGNSSIFFKIREFEAAPPIQDSFQLVVLDGQQRLTSLYQALYGKGAFRYGIKFPMLRGGQPIEELEDAILSLPPDKWNRAYPDAKSEYDDGVIPVKVLRQASDFYAWRDRALEGATAAQKSQVTDLYVSMLSGLDRYEVPAVLIDSDVHPEAVARIFERVNRLGQPLGTFDLVVAKSFSEDFNLREEWDRIQVELPRLGEFLKGDGLAVLSVIALQVRASVRQNDILQLSGAVVRDYWRRTAVALDRAITFLQQELHVWVPEWLPYRVQLSMLGGLALNNALQGNSKTIRSWFWRSIFQARYDIASNTRAVEDYARLVKGFEVGANEIVLDPESLFALNRRQYGALHRGVICLIASRDPLDPFAGLPVSSMLEGGDESPVTITCLGRSESPWGVPERLLSLGMLVTTRSSSRGSSEVRLADLTPEVLDSQLLPSDGPFSSMEGLLSERLSVMADALAEVSGTRVRITGLGEHESQA